MIDGRAIAEREGWVLSGAGPLLLLFGFLSALAIVLLLAYWLSDRRRMEMRALSMRLGWSFKYDAAVRLEAAMREFSHPSAESPAGAFCTLEGWLRVGHRRLPGIMGDHADDRETPRATPREGKGGTFSYLAVRLPFIGMPELIVRRQGLKDIAGSAFEPQRISLESDAFNRRYHIHCDDKKFAFAVLHPRMMEFLMEGRAPAIELRNGWMCLTDGPRHWQPAEFIARVSWAERFLALWPAYLWEELGFA